MAKGRHRKPQRTELPGGAKANTGKGRNKAKAAIYSRPLPVQVEEGPSKQSKGKGKEREKNTESWSSSFWKWLGYAPERRERKEEETVEVARGRWDPLSKSVQLEVSQSREQTKEDHQEGQNQAMRFLWQSGFFGKGTLSRSEPTWRERQINTIRVQRQRERGAKVFTPEELTALRRRERKAAKIERARLAVRAGQQLADGIVALGGTLTEEDEKAIERDVERELREEEGDDGGESAYGKHIPGLIYLKPQQREEQMEEREEKEIVRKEGEPGGDVDEFIDVEDIEMLQLSSYETLFLAGMLGVLEVVDERDEVIALPDLYALLLSSHLPADILPVTPLSRPSTELVKSMSRHWARPDNPFLLTYVAYHHYRSLGWVVKSGLKFCVDLLLYKKGPAFSHAEFALLIVPAYEDAQDAESSPFGPHPNGPERDWVWFSSVNRVNSQVLKTLVLCHVSIPPLHRIGEEELKSPEGFVEGLKSGQSFTVRETAVRRWVPARMRA